MVRSLADRGIETAFPIQLATIPPALEGRDVCGRAPTGSGKTLAFGIPAVLRVKRAKPHRPRALVLAPTRELAAQICDELRMLADRDQSVESFYGGVRFGNQVRALKAGVDIAVACPGRMADLINQGHVDLRDVDLVVLDEADRMADMGFLPEVRRLLDACSKKRQTLLFSATLDGDVDVIVKGYMTNPVRHEEAGADPDGPTAEHVFWQIERPDRIGMATQIVAKVGPTVVFCRTKRGADRVAKQMRTRGVSAVAIHGDRSQNQRERALEDFRSGDARAIVATDVAARGIHVDGVECVIHFDPTDDPKDYVHRSGRTGRAGNAGVVISFVPNEMRRDLVRQQKSIGREIQIVAPDVANLTEGEPQRAPRKVHSGDRNDQRRDRRDKERSSNGSSGRNRPGGSKPKGAGPSGSKPRGPKPVGAKPNGVKPNGAKANGPRPGGSKSNGSKPNGSKPNGSKPNGSKPNGAKANGAKANGAKAGSAKSRGGKSGGPRSNGPRPGVHKARRTSSPR
ncbi:MAG: DEAD/DEAH box helicase [Microthrixaceae bacterium]